MPARALLQGDGCTADLVVDGHSGSVVAFLRQAAAAWLLQRMGMDNLEECGQMLLDWVGGLGTYTRAFTNTGTKYEAYICAAFYCLCRFLMLCYPYHISK